MNGQLRTFPLHYVACDYPLATPSGSAVRVVITKSGVAQVLLDWFLAPRNRFKSRSWQRGYAQAFGLFYDFAYQLEARYKKPINQTKLLSDFAEALLHGTVQADGTDETDLFWRKFPFYVAEEHIKRLTRLSDYCVEQSNDEPINPWVSADWAERLAQFRRWDAANKNSLLRNIADRKEAWARSMQMREFKIEHGIKAERDRPPYFPTSKFTALIQEGFVRPGSNPYDPPHIRFNIRDMMIAILQGAGGLRESEPFHLFADDVCEDPQVPGSALVRVHHPSEGKYRLYDPSNRAWRVELREEFLRGQGLCPRHLLRHANQHAGWKDPLLIRDRFGDLYLQVHWFPSWWGKIFWHLYKLYVFDTRSLSETPFLFVSERAPYTGHPYCIKQYNKKLDRAVRLIGVEPKKVAGGTSHGLRHLYGQALADAGVKTTVLQRAMHHKSPNSTAIYTAAEASKVNRILNTATQSPDKFILPEIMVLE